MQEHITFKEITKEELKEIKEALNLVRTFLDKGLGLKTYEISVKYIKTTEQDIYARMGIEKDYDVLVEERAIKIKGGLIYVSDNFFKLSNIEKAGVLLHEIIHIADINNRIAQVTKNSYMMDDVRAEMLACAFEVMLLQYFGYLSPYKFIKGTKLYLFHQYFKGLTSFETFEKKFDKAIEILINLYNKDNNLFKSIIHSEEIAKTIFEIFGKITERSEESYIY